MAWSVVMTRPNQERIAVRHLERQAFTVFYPRTVSLAGRTESLFPRYLFVDITGPWCNILGTRGVSRLLLDNGRPAFVRAGIVETLQAKANEKGVILAPRIEWPIGASVRARDGAFVGLVGIYQGMTAHQRVRCLFALLGRQTTVELKPGSLELYE